MTYALIDSGSGQKLERFGKYTLIRPCSQAIWQPCFPEHWQKADALFTREPHNRWEFRTPLPSSWTIEIGRIRFKLALTDFGHLGLFPEHASIWTLMRPMVQKGMRILNLFAYSGGITIAAAQEGAAVCHLDASQGMTDWAKENATLNLPEISVRWIVDDAIKFLKREVRRNSFYEGIILDPPTFGRGSKGEVFKIERDLLPLLELCQNVLSSKRRFVILSCHTPAISPLILQNTAGQIMGKDGLETGEMVLQGADALLAADHKDESSPLPIPTGSYAIKTYR
jgi:23S rRNA (cytosine1962-C5)-methyltransferase